MAKILLADDDLGYRFPLRRQLERAGYEVIDVPDAEGVRQHYAEADVLILDARLPTGAMEGISLAAEARRGVPPPDWKPIIFISVHDRQECPHKLAEVPKPFEWLVKPFEAEALIELVEVALRK